jgi:lipopolysaccharide biosynthesis protein
MASKFPDIPDRVLAVLKQVPKLSTDPENLFENHPHLLIELFNNEWLTAEILKNITKPNIGNNHEINQKTALAMYSAGSVEEALKIQKKLNKKRSNVAATGSTSKN